jgi:hypothetical protein
MGTQTYEPNADMMKKRREVRKCPHQIEVGFRITGFQVYDVQCDTFGTVGKHFGRRLLPAITHEALALFFFDGIRIRRDVLLIGTWRRRRCGVGMDVCVGVGVGVGVVMEWVYA